MKLLSATLLAASMVSNTYAYANKCLSPLVNKGDCIAYGGKRFVSVDCDDKAGKKLKIVDGKLCAGARCLMRKKNKRGKIKVKMSKKAGKNCVYFDYNQADNQLVITGPNDLKGKYPVFAKGKINFNGKAGDVKCTIETPTTAAPTTAAPTTKAPTTAFPPSSHVIENICLGYKKYDNACMTYSDKHPTVNHPDAVTRHCSKCSPPYTFPVVANQTVESCSTLCNKEEWCIGFEFHSRPEDLIYGALKVNDCILNHKTGHAIAINCDGWGLDFHEKIRVWCETPADLFKLSPGKKQEVTMFTNFNLEFHLLPHTPPTIANRNKNYNIIKVTDKAEDEKTRVPFMWEAHPGVSFTYASTLNLYIWMSPCNKSSAQHAWDWDPQFSGIKAHQPSHIKITGRYHGTNGVMTLWVDGKEQGQRVTELCPEEKPGFLYTSAYEALDKWQQYHVAALASVSGVVWERYVQPPQPNVIKNNAVKQITLFEGYKLEFDIKPMNVDYSQGTGWKELLRIGNEDYTDAHPRIWVYGHSWDFQVMNSGCDNKLNEAKGGLTGTKWVDLIKMTEWQNWRETYYTMTILVYPQDGGMMEILVDGELKWKGPTKLCSEQNKKATLWMSEGFWHPVQAHIKNLKYEYYS